MSRVWVLLYIVLCTRIVHSEDREKRIVQITQGKVSGYKEDEIYSFYGIPYATAPTGLHKFKAPLPPPTWPGTFEGVNKDIKCPQYIASHTETDSMTIKEDCLIANIFVPDTTEKNLPVLVYVHGGAFQLGYGNIFTLKKLQQQSKQKFIVVNFSYRLGIHGFLCLGTDDVPGNAGMKDQVALLRWVNKNIYHFGGNPKDVTIAGCSSGSASVDLLMLSPLAKGLFNKVIPESGANLAAFAVQVDPLQNAKKFARSANFTEFDDVYALENFYKDASYDFLTSNPFFDRKDSTFLFSPCVEKNSIEEAFLEEIPYVILKSGSYEKVPMLYGFATMEGLGRVVLFDQWKNGMNDKFSDFLPVDLHFKDDADKEKVAKEIKDFYFGDKLINNDSTSILHYIDYFSDVFFTYGHLRALKLHIAAGHNRIYLYEYSFVDDTAPPVPYTDNVRGAEHCAQTAAIADNIPFTNRTEDTITHEYKKMKSLMRELWSNFITTGTPVPEGSSLPAWPAVDADGAPHMSLGHVLELQGDALLAERARFWDAIYERHYRAPRPPQPSIIHIDL